jgi:hypothetical protein
MVPIFCGNCGKKQGLVPEHYIRHVFALCQPCADSQRGPDGRMLGVLAKFYEEPDAEFFRKVNEEMRAARATTEQDILRELANTSSPLAKLAAEFRAKIDSRAA